MGGKLKSCCCSPLQRYFFPLLRKLKCAKDKDIYPKEMDDFKKLIELGTHSYLELCVKLQTRLGAFL